ncbi:MAG: deoxyribodipyrimidine photo-lyase [Campylobacterales bacterium]|nr:deoxyribodipyrimidine photo-lyase [Campylobacterales bacterium]
MRRILWFRRDLRVYDNPLLSLEGEVLPIFIFDKNILDKLPQNDARVTLLFSLVNELKNRLQNMGLDLKIFYSTPKDVFDTLPLENFDEVVASGDYDEYAKERDREISQRIHFRYLNDTYLFKPKEILKKDGTPYLVFTPYYKACLAYIETKGITEEYQRVGQTLYKFNYDVNLSLESMGFEKSKIECDLHLEELDTFFTNIASYAEKRDFINESATSNVSVALRFGVLSIRDLYRRAKESKAGDAYIRQLIFRDFYAYLLFHFPYLAFSNYKGNFNGIANEEKFLRICKAETGVPIVDAGIRELLQTGNMHNRVRMIVASFFTKDLLLPWQWGEAFFAQHLFDFDAASNILSWQWSAGTGIDPQPYFRIFNPYLQSKKFDKDAQYIKKYIPELRDIDAKYIHDESYLLGADITAYPKPIVEHKKAAKIAVESFKYGEYRDV